MKQLFSAVAACALTACGGGDGGAPVAPSPAPAATPAPAPASAAQGLRTSSSGGVTVTNVNLEDDQFWTVYSIAGLGYVGVLQGSHTVNGTALTGSGIDYSSGAATPFTLAGTFTAQGTASGIITPSVGAPYPFSLTSDSRYDQAAVQSTVTGAWTLLAAGTTTSVTVASNGDITGSNTACNLTGSVTPRPSGKNVFNASVTFSGPSCGLAGQTFNGIALALQSGGTTELIVAMLNGARTTAMLVTGTR